MPHKVVHTQRSYTPVATRSTHGHDRPPTLESPLQPKAPPHVLHSLSSIAPLNLELSSGGDLAVCLLEKRRKALNLLLGLHAALRLFPKRLVED